MKKIPLLSMFLAATLALALSACAANGTSLTGTTWKLASYGPKVAQTAAAAGVETNLTIGADGKLSGNMGCNSMGGDFTVSGDTITFKNVYATEMACAEPQMLQEGAALKVLQGSVTFKLDGDTLTVTSTDGLNVLTFTAIKTQ